MADHKLTSRDAPPAGTLVPGAQCPAIEMGCVARTDVPGNLPGLMVALMCPQCMGTEEQHPVAFVVLRDREAAGALVEQLQIMMNGIWPLN